MLKGSVWYGPGLAARPAALASHRGALNRPKEVPGPWIVLSQQWNDKLNERDRNQASFHSTEERTAFILPWPAAGTSSALRAALGSCPRPCPPLTAGLMGAGLAAEVSAASFPWLHGTGELDASVASHRAPHSPARCLAVVPEPGFTLVVFLCL